MDSAWAASEGVVSGAGSRSSSTVSSIRICPRRKAPSSVTNAVVTTSPQTRPEPRISSFCVVMLPRTAPATMTVLARTFWQVTRPVSPMTSIPRKAISPSKAPSMRTPPEPLIDPCQITPEPSTEVIRSTAWTGCWGSVGVVVLRLNIWRVFYLERGIQVHKKTGRQVMGKKHVSPSTHVSTCVPVYLLTTSLPLAFLFLCPQLYAHRIESRIDIEHFACDPF